MSEFLKRIQGLSAGRLALLAAELQTQLEREHERAAEPIAIIGLAGRYPGGCDDLDTFWSLLAEGRDAMADTPADRWDAQALYDPDPDAEGKVVTRRGGFIADFNCFDADFFGIPATEATTMDPQHRLLLETAWHALEDSGTSPDRWRGCRGGVFLALSTSDYADVLTRSDMVWDGYLAQGTAHSMAAGRLSYVLGFEGPSLAIDTACSSSLVAAHLACRSLQTGECDAALVGGANVLLSPLVSIDFSRARILSPSGLCRPFDARADGYVRGEGCGVMLLKRLSDAVRDGDRIRAVIRGSAVNHVGRGGLMTPKASAQEGVIRGALAAARVDAADIGYLEASSVGTALGDPIEIDALGRTLCRDRPQDDALLVGSVKTNVGHLEAAAGMAALSKVVLSLEHGEIPAHLHLDQPNPEIAWHEMPIRIPRQTTPWRANGSPRLAGVSAFSISGTNAHLVVEQAPPGDAPRAALPGPFVLPISARTADALEILRQRFILRLAHARPDELAAICGTAACGRVHQARRIAVVAGSAAEAVDQLRGRDLAAATPARRPRVAFVFPAGAGLPTGLACDIAAAAGMPAIAAGQPAPGWYALQVALAEMWRRFGVEPTLVIGEDDGECAAASVAGLFSAEAGAELVRARAGEAPLPAVAAGIAFQPERVRIVCGRSGRRTDRGELANADHWSRPRAAGSRLAAGLQEARQLGVELLLVVGFEPDPALVPDGVRVVATLHQGRDPSAALADGLARLYEAGVDLRWEAVHAGREPGRTTIPSYPFARRRLWPGARRDGTGDVRSGGSRAPGAGEAAASVGADDGPAAREPSELVVRRELARVLGCEASDIAPQVELTDLGLDSIRALQLKDRLSQLLRVELPIAQLAYTPTVAELSAFIDRQVVESAALSELPAIVPDVDGRFEAFALTDIQQAYWVGRHAGFELGGVATHAYFEYQLEDLDVDRLEHAIRRVVERHDMLRAVVLPTGRQVVLREVPLYRVEREDLAALDGTAIERRLAQQRNAMSHEVRQADRWPLFDVRASLLPGALTRLHVSVDLLIVDAWSMEILGREIAMLYALPQAELPPLELHFRDCLLAQSAIMRTEVYQRSERYWKDRIGDLPPAPQLPVASAPAAATPPRFVRRMARVDAAGWRRFRDRSRQAAVSPTVAVLTAFAEVLRAWSRHPRFTVNLTLFHRPPLHAQVNDIVGDFTSLTLLEADLRGQASFDARTRQLQRQLWTDLDHRYFGGVRVLRELAMRTGRPIEALMPVVFTAALGLGRETGGLGGLGGELIHAVSQTPQVWLDHQVLEDGGELVLIWDAVEDLFPAQMLDDMFDAYRSLLQRLADDGAAWDDPVGCLTPARQVEARRAFNATATPVSDELLHRLFARQAAADGDRPALITRELSLSRASLARRGTALATTLRRLGAGPGRLVAIVMDKGWEQVVAALAVLESGAAYVPVDARIPQQRLRHLLESCEVRIALTQRPFRDAVAWPGAVDAVLSDYDDPGGAVAPLAPIQTPDDLAYVIFTSGSSGLPKGVMIDHRGAVNTVLDINRRFGIGPADRTLALSSLSFDLSVWDLFGLLAAGGAVVLPDAGSPRDPAHWADLMETHGVTVWNSVPALMQLAADYARSRPRPFPASLRQVMLSGDWIPVTLPDELRALSPHGQDLCVVSLGGATEASIWSVFHPIDAVDPSLPSIPYGRPLANQSLHVLDDGLAPRPDGVPGDLFIGGIGLARGYWHDAGKTDAAFVLHPRSGERLYRTGDLARHLPGGPLEFLGREDSQVKVQGFRIELGEIEANLLQHPSVRQAVALVLGTGGSRRLAACVVGAAGERPSPEALQVHLAGRLPEHMIPQVIVPLEALPLSANGKVDTREIARLAADGPLAAEPGAGAGDDRDPMTLRLIEIVRTQLQLPSLDAHTNLLQVGASSLDMLQVVNEVERQIGFRPKIEEFFRRPTIAGLRELRRRFDADEPVAETGSLDALGDVDLAELAESAGADTSIVLDPRQRESLKQTSLLPRAIDAGRARVTLPSATPSLVELESFAARRSHRLFDERPLPLARLAAALGCLKRLQLDGQAKHLYGSAGGLYPVQTYLHVKPERVQGLGAGTYYLDPVASALVALSADAQVDPGIHVAYNQRHFEACAFSVFLVAETAVLQRLYGELGRHLACLEAGAMSQLLEQTGAGHGVGYCQIGTVDFERIRGLFDLRSSHVLVHSLVGGRIRDEALQGPQHEDADDLDEGAV